MKPLAEKSLLVEGGKGGGFDEDDGRTMCDGFLGGKGGTLGASFAFAGRGTSPSELLDTMRPVPAWVLERWRNGLLLDDGRRLASKLDRPTTVNPDGSAPEARGSRCEMEERRIGRRGGELALLVNGLLLLPGFGEVLKAMDGLSFEGGSGDVRGPFRLYLGGEEAAKFAAMER